MSNIKLAQQAIATQEERFKQIAPDMVFEKEAMYALQALSNNAFLQTCDAKSVSAAVLNVAMSGLTLNPVMGHGYLVPRKGKCVFQPGYQGLIYLLVSSGILKNVEARVVYANDLFEINYGTSTSITHKPVINGNPGDVIGVYAIATGSNDEKHIEYMTAQEVYNIAMRSDMNKKSQKLNGAWGTDFTEMARKTVIRRLFKYLPKNDAMNISRLASAMSTMDQQAVIEPIQTEDLLDIDFVEIPNEE